MNEQNKKVSYPQYLLIIVSRTNLTSFSPLQELLIDCFLNH